MKMAPAPAPGHATAHVADACFPPPPDVVRHSKPLRERFFAAANHWILTGAYSNLALTLVAMIALCASIGGSKGWGFATSTALSLIIVGVHEVRQRRRLLDAAAQMRGAFHLSNGTVSALAHALDRAANRIREQDQFIERLNQKLVEAQQALEGGDPWR